MKELFRLKHGKLSFKNEIINYFFGFVHDDLGELIIELYLEDNHVFTINDFIDERTEYYRNIYKIEGITDIEDRIIGYNLGFILFDSQKNSILLICRDHILIDKKGGILRIVDGKPVGDTHIFFIELEGLHIKYSEITQKDITKKQLPRNFLKNYTTFESDHSLFMMNFPIKNNFVEKHGIIYDNQNGENIFIEFYDHIEIDLFKKYKDQFVTFLSFINGGEVKIRRIFRGSTYSIRKFDSQKIEIYSFKKIHHIQLNEFVPINVTQYLKDKPFQRILQFFPSFIKRNNEFDFNSLIYYLNSATKTTSIEQKVFTLLIALEELASKFLKFNKSIKKTIVPDEVFKSIKKELKGTLSKYKSSLMKEDTNSYENLLAKLCDINSIKNITEIKIKELLNYSGIIIDTSIESLINKRHSVIHEAKIGDTVEDHFNYYYQLDNLLRDIILNLINYDGVRNKMNKF